LPSLAIRIRKSLLQLAGFGFMGLLSAGVVLLVPVGLHEIARVPVRWAYPWGLAGAIVLNFFACRRLIFQSRQTAGRQFIVFVASSFLFRGLEYAAFITQHRLFNLHYVVAIGCIHAVSFFIKFGYYKHFVFSPGGKAPAKGNNALTPPGAATRHG
jgi:putative flippase GtrA